MPTNQITMKSRAWYGDEDLTLTFPTGWEAILLGPKDAPALSPAGIAAAFEQPIGTQRIRDLAYNKRSAAIVVDDLSRPTPAHELLPHVLRELAAAGVRKQDTHIVVGGGTHRPLTAEELAKKVGADVAAEYHVTSHDFMSGDLRGLGNLPEGLPIFVNRIVADADFKICVGGIYPHGAVGFGGGSKLILPGVSGFASVFYFHTHFPGRGQGNIEREGDEPDHRDASEAVARVLGLDAIVNCVLNSRREIAGVFVGDFVQAHRVGARFALETYGTRIPQEVREETDLIVVNAYPLDSDPLQTVKAFWPRQHFAKAYTVAVNPAVDGICYHGLYDGMDYGRFLGQRTAQPPADPPAQVGEREQVHVWSQNFRADEFERKIRNGILFRDWADLLGQLAAKLPERAKVAVFPCASIQVLAEDHAPVEDAPAMDKVRLVA
jgi:nickel-dependent lactate racemase